MHRNGNPCNSFFMVKMASGMDHGRVRPTTTTATSFVVARRRPRWAHAPVIHAASHFDHKKRVAWVPISMHTCGSFFYNYGAPLCSAKNVNVLIAGELSGFTCTRSLTMNSKFSIPNFSFIVSELVQVNPDNSLAECVDL